MGIVGPAASIAAHFHLPWGRQREAADILVFEAWEVAPLQLAVAGSILRSSLLRFVFVLVLALDVLSFIYIGERREILGLYLKTKVDSES